MYQNPDSSVQRGRGWTLYIHEKNNLRTFFNINEAFAYIKVLYRSGVLHIPQKFKSYYVAHCNVSKQHLKQHLVTARLCTLITFIDSQYCRRHCNIPLFSSDVAFTKRKNVAPKMAIKVKTRRRTHAFAWRRSEDVEELVGGRRRALLRRDQSRTPRPRGSQHRNGATTSLVRGGPRSVSSTCNCIPTRKQERCISSRKALQGA